MAGYRRTLKPAKVKLTKPRHRITACGKTAAFLKRNPTIARALMKAAKAGRKG